MQPNKYDDSSNAWYWKYDDARLYYDIGDDVRLRVIQINFKQSNEINKIIENSKDNNNDQPILNDIHSITPLTKDFIMEILCTFNQDGLGPLKWWI